MPNIEKLKAVIEERGLIQKFIAEKMGLNEATLSRKLNGKNEFTVSEANAISSILQLSVKERNDIFFEKKVYKV